MAQRFGSALHELYVILIALTPKNGHEIYCNLVVDAIFLGHLQFQKLQIEVFNQYFCCIVTNIKAKLIRDPDVTIATQSTPQFTNKAFELQIKENERNQCSPDENPWLLTNKKLLQPSNKISQEVSEGKRTNSGPNENQRP